MSTATYTKITDTPVWKEVKKAAFVNEIPCDALAGCVKMALEDHKAGRTITHDKLMEQIKKQRGWE